MHLKFYSLFRAWCDELNVEKKLFVQFIISPRLTRIHLLLGTADPPPHSYCVV